MDEKRRIVADDSASIRLFSLFLSDGVKHSDMRKVYVDLLCGGFTMLYAFFVYHDLGYKGSDDLGCERFDIDEFFARATNCSTLFADAFKCSISFSRMGSLSVISLCSALYPSDNKRNCSLVIRPRTLSSYSLLNSELSSVLRFASFRTPNVETCH